MRIGRMAAGWVGGVEYSFRALLVVLVVMLTSVGHAVFAQSPPSVRVISRVTSVVVSPRTKSEVVMSAVQGTVLEVLGKEGDWYWVILPPDTHGTRRPGWVAARDVEIVGAQATTRALSTPDDLELRHLRAEVEALRKQLAAVQSDAPKSRSAADAADKPQASVARTSKGNRFWVDVNIGIAQPAADSYTVQAQQVQFGERATYTTRYSFPSGVDFDFGGGYMFTPRFGVGVSFVGTAHEAPATLGIEIPHPNFFDAFAVDSAPTDTDLARVEASVNLQAAFVAVNNERLRLRLFAGPTFFSVKQDTIRDIRYEQAFLILSPVNAVGITTFAAGISEASAWGWHAGGDVSWFFNRVAGVGVRPDKPRKGGTR